MAFISLNDFLIALSLLYFFDFQGSKQRVLLRSNSYQQNDLTSLISKKGKTAKQIMRNNQAPEQSSQQHQQHRETVETEIVLDT